MRSKLNLNSCADFSAPELAAFVRLRASERERAEKGIGELRKGDKKEPLWAMLVKQIRQD